MAASFPDRTAFQGTYVGDAFKAANRLWLAAPLLDLGIDELEIWPNSPSKRIRKTVPKRGEARTPPLFASYESNTVNE